MESYTDFAQVYDEFMDTVPYQEWCERIVSLINEYGISKTKAETHTEGLSDKELALLSERDLILDLGCGTGTLTQLLADAGFDVMGIDLSGEMLQEAMEKSEASGHDIMYLCQDMRELEMYCTVGTVVCICDSINYVLEDEEVVETFRRVNTYLYPKGIFIFDFNTNYKYREVIGDTTIAESREECSFIWDNFYDEETHVNEYDLTIFVQEGEDEQIFRRFQETHYQRGYELAEMLEFVRLAGLEFVTAFDADTQEEADETTQRVLMVCREKGKEVR